MQQLRSQPKFSLAHKDNFLIQQKVGKGEYGDVYKCLDHKTKDFIAIKKIRLQKTREGFSSLVIREIGLLNSLNHKHILKINHTYCDNDFIYLITDYVHSDLNAFITSHLQENKRIEPRKIKIILYSILEGVALCHAQDILHRDLKTDNILMDSEGNLKIADFGQARRLTFPRRPYTENVVALWYRAPELLLGLPDYSTPIDVWSVGCIFAEMVAQKVILQGDSEVDQLYRIFKLLGTPNDRRWPGVSSLKNFKTDFPNFPTSILPTKMKQFGLGHEGIDLMEKLLELDPRKRISAQQALSHCYFDEIKAI